MRASSSASASTPVSEYVVFLRRHAAEVLQALLLHRYLCEELPSLAVLPVKANRVLRILMTVTGTYNVQVRFQTPTQPLSLSLPPSLYLPSPGTFFFSRPSPSDFPSPSLYQSTKTAIDSSAICCEADERETRDERGGQKVEVEYIYLTLARER